VRRHPFVFARRACRQQTTFDDLDSIIAGSRLRGRLALTLGDEKNIEGELGLDQMTLAPLFALAIGAAGHECGRAARRRADQRLARAMSRSGAARLAAGRQRIADRSAARSRAMASR